jgi:hypothetical protein
MMELEVGNRDFPLWLIGDSNPAQWESSLLTPLDPRHPVRHNIWTSVLDVMQDRVYREARLRIDSSRLYIRNALADSNNKPAPSERQWGTSVQGAISDLQQLIKNDHPIMLFCFGAFAFEFVRRALGEAPPRKYGHWGARRLGEEFRARMAAFDLARTNAIPLLHRSIAGGKFIEAHEFFCGEKGANYFERAGTALAQVLLQNRKQLRIWIE